MNISSLKIYYAAELILSVEQRLAGLPGRVTRMGCHYRPTNKISWLLKTRGGQWMASILSPFSIASRGCSWNTNYSLHQRCDHRPLPRYYQPFHSWVLAAEAGWEYSGNLLQW